MSNLDIIAQSTPVKLAWLLEIAGLPYRYYCGAAPDEETIPGMEIAYTDLPLIVDTPTQFAGRLNPTEPSFSIDSARVSLAFQQGKERVDSDPVVVFLKRDHPSKTFAAQLTESVGLFEPTVADPLYLKVDRDLSELPIDEEFGTLFYIHQEPFLVTEFLGDNPDPTSATAYRLKAIARGARDSLGLLRAPIREHIVSPLINNYPIVQYKHCANWRGRFCKLRYAPLDMKGRRIGELNSKGEINSDYSDYVWGFIDLSPSQEQGKKTIAINIQPHYSKNNSKLAAAGGVALTTGEHYFHQVETVEGADDWHGAATTILVGLELGQGTVGTNLEYWIKARANNFDDPNLNEGGDSELTVNDSDTTETWQKLYDTDAGDAIGLFHPRKARTLSRSFSRWVQYIDSFDVIAGHNSIDFELGYILENDIPDGTIFTNAYGLEYKANITLDLLMEADIPLAENQPISTIPWPGSVNIFQAGDNKNTGVDGGWLDVSFLEDGKFKIIPNEDTVFGVLSSNGEDDFKLLGRTPFTMGSGRPIVNTPALIWGYDIYPAETELISPAIGGVYTNRDDEQVSLFGNPLDIIPKWSTLWYPIIPYGEDTFAWRPLSNRDRRVNHSTDEGEGQTGGYTLDTVSNAGRKSLAWGMPAKSTSGDEYECYVAKGFAQEGERYILVDEFISVDSGSVIITWAEPSKFDRVTGEVIRLRQEQRTVSVESIEAISSITGSDKYLIKTTQPLRFSFGDWTDIDEEVWTNSGLDKQGPVIAPGNIPKEADIATFLTYLYTDPNGLGWPTDYLNTDSLNVLQERLLPHFGGDIWTLPFYANKLEVNKIVEGILLLAGCQFALEINADGIQQASIRPADEQLALFATSELSRQLISPLPQTDKDDRLVNTTTINYRFNSDGEPSEQQTKITNIDRDGLSSVDFEPRGRTIDVHGFDQAFIESSESIIVQSLKDSSIQMMRKWSLPRTLWKFSVPLSDGIRSLLGATILVTSDLLEGYDVTNLDSGIIRQPGIVLEQKIDFNKAEVSLVVSSYPGSNATGYNAGFYGIPSILDPTKTLVIPEEAARAFSQSNFEGQVVYDAALFAPQAFDYEVSVAPVHKPDEFISTTITGVGEAFDGSWTITFDDIILHPDDANETFAYRVSPLGYDEDIGFLVLLAFFADASGRLGADNARGNTWL